jgi:hypothetical protein
VLDNVRGVADDPRQDQFVIGELDVLPDLPYGPPGLMADIASLERAASTK